MSTRQTCPYCGAKIKPKFIWNHVRSKHPAAYKKFGWDESDPARETEDYK